MSRYFFSSLQMRKLFFNHLTLCISLFLFLALLAYGFSTNWEITPYLKKTAEGLAGTALGVCISLFVIQTQFEKHFDTINLIGSGIRAYNKGFTEILQEEGGISNFFNSSYNKEIDIFGMAMLGFFEAYPVIDTLIKQANSGYKVRVFWANPTSTELAKQESIEDKEKELQASIIKLTNRLYKKLEKFPNASKNIHIYYTNILPRSFILRSGSKMIVTNYLYNGPKSAPSLQLRADTEDGMFAQYLEYLNETAAPKNSTYITSQCSEL